MVKVSNLTIKNFKFYINESIDINSQNFLIYGENGVGKSSLFQSLYYLFYGYFDNSLINHIEQFKNRDSSEDIELEVEFSNNENIKIDKDSISSNVSILEKQNIYLLDYKFLDNFTDKNDFFITLENIQNRFIIFDNIFNDINNINQTLEVASSESLNPRRVELNTKLNQLISNIEDKANQIIIKLKESFTIKINLEEAELEEGALRTKLHKPKIYIDIDGIRDFKSHFNESKIKILSLAIVFALIKINQEHSPLTDKDNIKLLVLDDFLSSLDMGNRLYIMEYIFNNFEEYQKIILTHNSLFFNIIKRLIHVHGKFDKWEYKNIYQSLKNDGLYEPKILEDKDYLSDAKTAFDNLDYEQCGNLLRKEIERIIAQSTFLFRTGKKEILEDAITHIRQRNKYYVNSNFILEDMNIYYEKFKTKQFINESITVDRKLEILMKKLDKCFEDININSDKLNQILENINFYQTILNQASHYESEAECYRVEYNEALEDVKKLKEVFNNFNKSQ